MIRSRISDHDPNQALYSRHTVANYYTNQGELFPAEQVILERVMSSCNGRPILDVGVGAGRTTSHLLRVSADYLGIDYSSKMVERCRQRFPGVRFELADARRLEAYPEGHFVFILFSLNGIDYVSHDDRLIILGQLKRLLAKDGLFAFSTHNRQFSPVSPFSPKRLAVSNPLKIVWRLGLYFAGIVRYLRLRRFTYEAPEHALRMDGAFNYSLITYNIAAPSQQRQLQRVGFELMTLFNAAGEEIEVESHDASPWLYYLAHKAK